MNKSEKNIKNYWNKQAQEHKGDPRATTREYWLRELEIKNIAETLKLVKVKNDVLDIGCGDGFSTLRLAKIFPRSKFLGADFSEEMIENARFFFTKNKQNYKKINFQVADATNMKFGGEFDVVISDRCIINLTTRLNQEKAVKNIAHALRRGGHYIMVENFMEGNNAMNILRKRLSLKEIPVRWHNLYLTDEFIKKAVQKHFYVIKKDNFSSLFYLLTKVIYSKMCQLEGKDPNYDNPIYKIAFNLNESCGNYGPVSLLFLRKK